MEGSIYGGPQLSRQNKIRNKKGSVHFADPQSMDYHDGLPKWTTKMDYPKLPVTGRFDRSSFRSKPKVNSIEGKSQFDRRVNVYKNYSFASV